jgi:hypothetical protein
MNDEMLTTLLTQTNTEAALTLFNMAQHSKQSFESSGIV